jgi:DNA-binding NarL/FixJ family response regulator
MTKFSITEARARFCYHPGVTHTVMSERRAAELMASRALQDGHRGAIPFNREEMVDPKTRVRQEVVLPMIDSGLGVEDVAVKLGVSPETIRDRLRLWRPVREKQRGRR